ncbi:MAG TPA: sterol desaturase family protein [Myxococcota bacterium]
MSAPATSAPAASAPRAPSAPADAPATLRAALPVFLRHASPRLLMVALAVALAARIAVGGFSIWDVVALLALLAYWPIQEWLIHVYILHRKPIHWRGRTIDFRVPRKHRAHHADPWRLDLVFIPFHSFAYSLPIMVGLWWLVTPNAQVALTGICGHLLLALHYEWVHFLCHTRVSPRLGYYQRLVKNHRWHHFKNERYWYGVTMLGGDRLLGTAPDPATVPTSPTARSLGVAA